MKATGKKRLFVAVDISDDVRGRAADYLDGLRRKWPDAKVSWTKPENLHLTLKFLGDVDESRVDEVCKAVRDAAASAAAFELEIGGTGVFPSKRKPKVIWLGMSDLSGKLKYAVMQVEEKLEKIGFSRDEREFAPHLTIGRVRDPRSARALSNAHIENEFAPIRFDVKEIVLYQSTLDPGGSIYKPTVTEPLTSI
jgi:2'-5' RNA ligase